MSWSWTLYRYLALRFLSWVAIAYGAVLVIAFSGDIVELLNRTAEHGVDTGVVIGMAVLHLPDMGLQMLPFAILFGAALSFVQLSRSQELVAARAAGVSAWDFLMPALSMAVLIGIFTVTVATPISSKMFTEFAALEARYVKGQASQLAVSENGLWLRQGDAGQQSVIHALTATDQGARLQDVLVFLYSGDRLTGRIDAKAAMLQDHSWRFNDAWVYDGVGKPRHHDDWQLATTLTPEQIQENFAKPETLSFWQLPDFIRVGKAAGFSFNPYQIYLYSLYALPGLYAAMVFMAASFSLRPAREGGMIKVLLLSAAAGFGVYFFKKLTETLGISGAVPVLLAATAPAIASILIGMTLVFSREDG